MIAYSNNKGVDQPAHPRSLTSTSIVCCLGSMSTKALQRLRKPAHDMTTSECPCKPVHMRTFAIALAVRMLYMQYRIRRMFRQSASVSGCACVSEEKDKYILYILIENCKC